jgi:hypothetical protein
MSKQTNPSQKVWIFFENRKVLKLFRFSYKIAKTANSKTALTSHNTWIWRLKFGLRVQNESYSILFTRFFDFKRKWFHMCRASNYWLILKFTLGSLKTSIEIRRSNCKKTRYFSNFWIVFGYLCKTFLSYTDLPKYGRSDFHH